MLCGVGRVDHRTTPVRPRALHWWAVAGAGHAVWRWELWYAIEATIRPAVSECEHGVAERADVFALQLNHGAKVFDLSTQ